MTVSERPKPVDLKALVDQPCNDEKVLLTGLADGRVMVQSTFKDVEFLRRMLRIASEGVELMAQKQLEEDEKEARQPRPFRANGRRSKRLPPPGEPPAGLG